MKKYVMRSAVVVFVAAILGMSCKRNDNDDEERRWNILALAIILYNANPCNFAGTPSETSAGPRTTNAGVGSVKGRVITTTGAPVVNALVIADGGTQVDANSWSSHTSIARDGSFLIAGIPTGAGALKLGVEPVQSTFYGRIDTHIDCFMSPLTFTSGWYQTGGGTTSSYAGASTFTVSGAGVTNLGTITVVP